MLAQDWKAKGQFQKIHGKNIFYIDTGKNTTSTPLTILHGYPTSSFDYIHTLDKLSQNRRVVAHDHLGFGFSDKPLNYSYSLIEQADHALALWKQLGIDETILLAHDYGTSVATEIIARRAFGYEPVKIKALILCNGSVHIELSQLRTIQKLLRSKWTGKYVAKLTTESIFVKNVRNVFFDKKKADTNELKEHWKMLEHNGGRKVIHQLTQYISERYLFWDRWIGHLRQIDIPVFILWGKNDPVAIPAIAERLHEGIPHSKLIWIDEVGHFPMIEKPEEWSDEVIKILNEFQ